MQVLSQTSTPELEQRVFRYGACTQNGVEIPSNVFVDALHLKGEVRPTKEERMELAAPFCGSCAITKGCLEIALRRKPEDIKGSIFGGYYFASRNAYHVVTKTSVPIKQLRSSR